MPVSRRNLLSPVLFFYPEDGSSRFFRNNGTYPSYYRRYIPEDRNFEEHQNMYYDIN
jgi:hypothetical protein